LSDQYLIDCGLSSSSGVTTQVVSRYVPNLNFKVEAYSDWILTKWTEINLGESLDNNTRGSVFETLIGICLLHAGITPFFRQAEVTYVNNARFDFLLWEDGWNPIALSIKTSLRERYKQAELEAGALKNVHQKSKNYLITLSSREVAARRQKLNSSREYSKLDGYVLVDNDSADLDELILFLSSKKFSSPEPVNPMANNLGVALKK
jgi:hypothetical protein